MLSAPALSEQSFSVAPKLNGERFRKISRSLEGIAFVSLATFVGYQLRLNLAAVGFLQLLPVLAVALKAGFWEATVVSVIANLCLNYFFIPPTFTFTIADPQNWAALIAFEISALVVSRLSTEAQRQASQATMRQRELERVYEISRQLLLFERNESPAQQILALIQRVFSVETAVFFSAVGSQMEVIGNEREDLKAQVQEAFRNDRDQQSSDERTWVRVLRFGVRPIGAIGLRGGEVTALIANAIASLSAIALERLYSFERESRSQAERQSEQLRTTVLDALAHEYKTPLTAIRTATSGLMAIGHMASAQSELVSLIDSETRRLNDLTTRLLQMSRLDSSDVRFRPGHVYVDELVQGVLADAAPMLAGHSLQIEGLETEAQIEADSELVHLALIQYLDNAAKYSDPVSPIAINVRAMPGVVRISVRNAGSLIPSEEWERIFQRFYRGSGTKHKASGTGIGLSITKKVADLHRGRAWANSSEAHGNTFFLELPRSRMEHNDRVSRKDPDR